MNKTELKTIGLLAGIYIVRMLGLFLIFPSFSLLAKDLPNATPEKIGFALGAYSLSQAILQIPAGWLSDIIGRKKVLYVGITLFLFGSLLAAFADSIETLIIARLLQGTGAISAVCLAYVGDNIRSNEQGKAMMIIGIAIGFAFMLAFIFGALISEHWGLKGLFFTTALLAIFALVLAFLLPTPEQTTHSFNIQQFNSSFFNGKLFTVNVQVALLHMILSASFFLLPLLLNTQQPETNKIWLYVLPLLITVIAVGPLVRNRDKGVSRLPIFWLLFSIVLISMATLPFLQSSGFFMTMMSAFFISFTLIETLLPAQLLQFASKTARGTTSGVFSLYQMGGSFIGGLVGAKCYEIFSSTNDTIEKSFYVLAIPAVCVVLVSLFINKQNNR